MMRHDAPAPTAKAPRPPTATGGILFGECLVDDFGALQRPGGAPFNVAQHLWGLGMAPRFVSRVGDDDSGHLLRERVRGAGGDPQDLQVDARLPTGRVRVHLQGDGQHHFEILPHQAYDAIEIPVPLAQTIPWLYHGTLALRETGASSSTWRTLCARSSWRFVDINLRDPWWHPQRLREQVRGASILKLNVEEWATLAACFGWSVAAPQDVRMASLARQMEVDAVLLTLGAQGAAFWESGTFLRQDAVAMAQVQDTVGAGDAFTAGWLWGYLRDEPPQRCLQRGADLAASVCGMAGALPDRPDFYRRILQQWGV
ncbi:PfkB family carbohydrate kinase [Acidithiobacillus sp. IBUN Pt1247-S3]|uniref:PfkB family carbohydrate kinase n=1 Tax=Acidithiobacillus sp. IBUN Pt1247-S3 TaxID=3166642 RepID=UPI0034E6182C